MSKQLMYDPDELRKPSYESFNDIPVNRYRKVMSELRDEFTDKELINIYYDMFMIRIFEELLQSLRLSGEYKGNKFNYTGPAHLSIGQEAAAVGQAFVLGLDDFIFGSHRSHGELIAKGLSAIRKLRPDELTNIMESYFDGVQYRIIRAHFDGDTEEIAVRFYIYGILSEIFGRITGFAKGLGNSMHAFFIPFGVYPNNAIVGGSAPIAAGAALHKKIFREKGICVANIGDGSTGCGPVWEAMNFAGMDQFNTLWENKGGLPILFNFNNNGYGMGGQTNGETMSFGTLARIGAGINRNQMHAERVDGFNVFAVIDAVSRQKKLLQEGKGPALLDILTYRFCGHSTSDANPNRTSEEVQKWKEQDPVADYRKQLISNGVLCEEDVSRLENNAEQLLLDVFNLARDEDISPHMDLRRETDAIEKYMFSNLRLEKTAHGEPSVLCAKEENARWQQIMKKSRSAVANGKKLPSAAVYQNRDAVFEAILDAFYRDPGVISFGEDLRDWGSAYGAYKNLEKSVPYERLFNSGISEATIVSASIGYCMLGGRAIPELMYCDFLGRAGDEVLNQLPKWQAMTAGQLKMPVVLRMQVGSKYGAQHSQEWSSICAHIPGLKVVYPVTPYDTKGLLNTALNGSDPVVFLENQSLYGSGEEFHEGGVPTGYYEIPIGEPDIKRRGRDLTILTIGATLYKAIKAADKFEKEFNISVEVIDARSIVPFNYEKVIESVKKTGCIIISSDACQRGSIINDFAENITRMCFDYLDAPPIVLGARNWITPVYELEREYFPQETWFLDAYHQQIKPLEGYFPTTDMTISEDIRRSLWGV